METFLIALGVITFASLIGLVIERILWVYLSISNIYHDLDDLKVRVEYKQDKIDFKKLSDAEINKRIRSGLKKRSAKRS